MRKVLNALTALLVSALLLAGCGQSTAPNGAPSGGSAPSDGSAPAPERVTLKVGVTAGPHEQIINEVKPLLSEENIDLDIHVFTDYKIPNQALQSGDLDVNIFQHVPYLETENAERGFNLVSIANAVTFPMGVYSDKVTDLADLPTGATVAIPNDPTNGGRALLVLQQAGLITLNDPAELLATPRDVADNPRELKFHELDAALLPRAVADVDAAVINTNYAISAGLDPNTDAIYVEQDSPYVNVIVVRAGDENRPEILKLVEVYQSEPIREFIDEEFQGAILPGW